MAPPVKIGLMGYGSSTKIFHLPFILPNPDLEVIAFLQRAEAPSDPSKVEAGKHCTVDHPKARHYRTKEDFLADAEIECVVVCTSSETHFELGKAALEAGKHVVIEKPFTVTSAEADALIRLAKEKGRMLTVYQNRRYDSDYRTLRHLISRNPSPFGKVTEFQNFYDIDDPAWVKGWRKEPGEAGEGMLYGLGTHSLDQTLQLFGQPASVTAFTRVLRDEKIPGGADDSFTVVLQYSKDDNERKDLICTVKTTIVSRLPMAMQPKFLVRGTGGSFVKNGEDVQVEHHFNGMKASDAHFGKEPESYYGYLHTRSPFDDSTAQQNTSTSPGTIPFSGKIASQPGSYMDYYRDVVKAIRGEGEVVVKAEESRMGIRVIELARRSVKEGRTVEWSERE